MGNLSEEDIGLIKETTIFEFYEQKIKEGLYPNIRMLKNDIEDTINYEILRAKNIL